jgi:hypothetical protein
MDNKTDKEKKDKPGEKYSQDFKNLKFSGTTQNPLMMLIVNWVFILLVVIVLCYFLKSYVLPVLSTFAGNKIVNNLGKLIKTWKGGRSP